MYACVPGRAGPATQVRGDVCAQEVDVTIDVPGEKGLLVVHGSYEIVSVVRLLTR